MSSSAGTKPNEKKTNGNAFQTPIKSRPTDSAPQEAESPPYSATVSVNTNAVLAELEQVTNMDRVPKSVVATGTYTPLSNRLGPYFGNSGHLPGRRPPTLATGPHAGHVSGLTGSATSVTQLAPTKLIYPIENKSNATAPKRKPGSSGGRRRKTKHRKYRISRRHTRKHRKTRRRVHFDRI